MNNLGSPVQIFARNTISMVLREMRSRYSDQKLSYVWALLEPLGWITMLSVMFMSMGSHQPPVGHSFFLFFVTGVVPFAVWRDTAGAVLVAVNYNKPLLYFPIIKPIDCFVSRAVLEICTHTTVLVFLITGHNFIVGGEWPDDWLNVILPLSMLAIIGFNTGLINCVIVAHFKEWAKIWAVINRPLFFLSGIFFTADAFPPAVRDLLYWNPLLHCIEWLRSGYFRSFESQFVDKPLVVAVTLAGFCVALAGERLYRRKILE